MNPYHISDRYKFLNGQYYSHRLNGITVFVNPDSIEGRLIYALTSRHYNSMHDNLVDELSIKFKKWNKKKGFDWD